MIKYEDLLNIDPIPEIINIPNKEKILQLIYFCYEKYGSLDKIDKYYETNVCDMKYYVENIRPILKYLFSIGQPKININEFINEPNIETHFEQPVIKISNISELKIKINMQENYEPEEELILNNSQKQLYDIYKKNDLCSGIICHATATGKTFCMFITIGFSKSNKNIFIFCNYKNVLRQMFFDEDDKFNYEQFRKLKPYFNVWDYDIYDLSDDHIRNTIIANIDHIARLIEEIVEAIDTGNIEKQYSELGQKSYDPKILIKKFLS